MSMFARCKFVSNVSTWSASQHTSRSGSAHSSPHTETRALRKSSDGGLATSLSGQGSGGPKPSLPQFPRRAHRPDSCLGVIGVGVGEEEVVGVDVAIMVVERKRRRMAAMGSGKRMARMM
jgi:hypothetical protein